MKILTAEQLAGHFKLSNPLRWMHVTQPFGVNPKYYNPIGLDGHDGLDLRARTPKECYAVCDGIIHSAGFDNDGGGYVKVMSDEKNVGGQIIKLEILYYHLSQEDVDNLQRVSNGDYLALTGNTGRYSSASHLHFKVRPHYKTKTGWFIDWNNGFKGAVDPMPMMSGELQQVDEYYGKKRNWIIEYTFRFANTPEGVEVTPFLQKRIEDARYVHKRLGKEGRNPTLLTDREANAIIYGAWDLDTVLDPAMFQTWSQMTKEKYINKI